MAKVAVESVLSGTSCSLESIGTPSGVAVTNIGTAGATTYGYRISAVNASGETLASASTTTTTGNASLTTGNFNRITWNRVMEASSYKIYGRTNGSELYMSSTTNLHFDDVGAITPSGALPSTDTTDYDSSKINLGSAFTLFADNGVGPCNVSVSRPQEANIVIPVHLAYAVTYSNDIDWIFFADNASAAATRRIVMYEYYRRTNTLTWKGFITLTFPSATSHTIRGLGIEYEVYTKGSVAVSGTGVTGTGSTWQTDRLAVGSRIGFGATDPSKITRWYEISAIASDTSITLTGSVDATISAGSAYCIDDLRVVTSTTNATAANGGLFVTKGLRPELFITSGTTISAATTVDNIRACYWLADAASVTNQTSCGCAIENKTSFTSQMAYVIDGTSTPKVYKYNTRAALTLASGKDSTSLTLQTATQAVTGTVSQLGNGRIITAAHGTGSGVSSLYYVTTTRVQRAAVSNITAANATWNSDSMTEVPPGGTNTYAASALMNTIDYIPGIDRFIVWTSGVGPVRHYVTQYQTGGSNFDSIFGLDVKQLDQTTADFNVAPPSPNSSYNAPCFSYSLYNTTYVVKVSVTANLNNIYTTCYTCDYAFANITGQEQSLITPSISCPNNVMFYRAYINNLRYIGENSYNHIPPEPIKILYRTSGISDNSGGWTLLPAGGNLTSVSPSSTIQFKIEFKSIGGIGLPSRVYSMCVVYEDSLNIPSHLKWNFDDTNNTTAYIGFIQTHYYGSVPNLQIDYYRSDTDVNVLSQASTGTTNGTFEYWDGSAWTAGNGTDTVGLRRRFRPTASLPSGVNVYARLKVI